MRIGIFIGESHGPGAGGSSTYLSTALEEILKTKSQHQFFVFYKGQTAPYEDTTQVKFIPVNHERSIKLVKRKLFGKSKVKEISVSILNRKALECKIEFMWFPALAYEFVEAPYILTVWDLQHRLQPYFPEVSLTGWTFEAREEFYSGTIPAASYIIIGNQEGARQVEKFYNFPLERIKTISFAVPHFITSSSGDDEILSKYQLQKNSYIFYPAQFWPHKNHVRILQALAILKKEGRLLQVVFTGSDKGNEDYIKAKAEELGLAQDVKFLGFVSKSELISLYQNALALAFPSMFGPDNIPPLEAMALNCPVICSNSKGMEEQLGDAALFFNPTNSQELAEKIKLLLDDEAVKQELIKKGANLARSLTADSYIQKFLSIVDEFSPIRECWSSEEKYIHL